MRSTDLLLQWLRGFRRAPELTCLVHGETVPMDALKARIEAELRWSVRTPEHLETISF